MNKPEVFFEVELLGLAQWREASALHHFPAFLASPLCRAPQAVRREAGNSDFPGPDQRGYPQLGRKFLP